MLILIKLINLFPIKNKDTEYVVQHYIHDPLLIEGKKFDLRIYVLISSIDPFICYVCEEGLARFCTEDYKVPNNDNFKNGYMHLTNYSFNKDSKNFIMPDDSTNILEINNASKRTITSVWKNLT